MKIATLSKEERNRRQEEAQAKWHLKFAWFPTRIDNEMMVWLEKYARRNAASSSSYSGSSKPEWRKKIKEDYIVDVLKGTNRND